MRVAACQMPDVCGDVGRAIGLVAEYTAEAERQGARLVCFPEAYLQGYVTEREHVEAFALELASDEFSALIAPLASLEPVIVVGLFERDELGHHNSAVVLDHGRVLGRYRKRHLIGRENHLFTPGTDQPLFDVDDVRFSINICYDMQFPACAAEPAAGGARLLVCPANNMLLRPTAETWKHRHNELRTEHARSAGVWLLSADVTGERGERVSYGPTALIDPQGRVVAQLPMMSPGILVADVSSTGDWVTPPRTAPPPRRPPRRR